MLHDVAVVTGVVLVVDEDDVVFEDDDYSICYCCGYSYCY
jgi:hypothetical protein